MRPERQPETWQSQTWQPQTWQPQTWRSEAGSRLWLSGLIAAMEHAERPDVRRQPVAPEILLELRAQLALTALVRAPRISTLHH